MSTYKLQYTSGSATSTADLGDAGMGIRNDARAGINPTNLAYGFYGVDASGRVFVDIGHSTAGEAPRSIALIGGYNTGSIEVQPISVSSYGTDRGLVVAVRGAAGFPIGVTGLVTGLVTASAEVYQASSPWIVSDTFLTGVFAEVTGTNGVLLAHNGMLMVGTYDQAGSTTQFLVSESGSALVSGTVSATATLASGTQQIGNVSAYVSGTATVVQGTTPWTVSGNVTANPASSTALTADRIGSVSGQTVASFNYVKASGADSWDRWIGVPSGATGSAVSGVPVVAPFFQRNDTPVSPADTFFGVPRIDANRNIIITASATLPVTIAATTVTAGQGTSPWVVSLATTTATISGTATVIPSTSTGVSADGLAGANSQIVASFNYIKTSGADTWQRWQSVPSGGTASGVGTGIPMVASMFQRNDTPISPADTFFAVGRIDSNRNQIVTASASWPVVATASWGISGSVTVLATALTAVPASSTALTADGIGSVSGQTVAGFNFMKSSGADTWDRWRQVPSGGTSVGPSGMPMVAAVYQRNDTGGISDTQWAVPRLDGNKVLYVGQTAAYSIAGTVTASASGAVQGPEAHAAAGTLNPFRLATKAAAFSVDFSSASNITAGDASAVNWYGTRTGIPFVLGGAPDMQTVWIQPTAVSSNSKLVVPAASTTKIVVLGAGVTLASTATTGVAFRMAFPSASGASGLDTVASSTAGNLTANVPILSHSNIYPGGGITRGDAGGIIAVGGAGFPIYATWTAPTNGALDIWVSYVRVPS